MLTPIRKPTLTRGRYAYHTCTAEYIILQRTGVDKNMGLGGWTPYHLKSAQGRCRHHLKWPFSFFRFMCLVGYLHPINPFIWPHLRLHFWHLIVLREEKRREKSILKDNLAVVLAVYSVD